MRNISFRRLASLCAALLFALGTATYAQEAPAPGGAAPVPDTSDIEDGNSDPTKIPKQGLRFAFKTSPGNDARIFMPLGTGSKSLQLKISKGVPADRVPFPKGRKVYLFDGDIYIKDAKPNQLAKADVPPAMGPKVLCLVTPAADGYRMEFIDESTLKIGSAFLTNMTTESLGLRIFDAQQKPVKTITLEPGQKEEFSPGVNKVGSGKSNIYPTQLCRKDDKGNWYVFRSGVLEVSTFGSLLVTFNWNDLTNSPVMDTITVRPDRPEAKPDNGRGAAPNPRTPRNAGAAPGAPRTAQPRPAPAS